MKKEKILIFNISTDSNNTSLGFAINWLNQLSEYYIEIDVVTLNVGATHLLNDGERGFIIPMPPDKKIIAENISFIIRNKTEATKRANEAKLFIDKKHNFLEQANQYMKIFEQNEIIEL